jgi:altronate hydrolase
MPGQRPAAQRLLIPNAETDNVGIAIHNLDAGDVVAVGTTTVTLLSDIPAGHKVALRDLPLGESVYKLGHPIGFATVDINAGEHVHVHNLDLTRSGKGRGRRSGHRPENALASWEPPVAPTRDHFLGYRRSNGKAATRNYVGLLPSVNCAATVARLVAQQAMVRYPATPSFDGVVALTHDLGCAMAEDSIGDAILRRTLNGYAVHPNLASVLVISLGCEVNQPKQFLNGSAADVEHISIQELGGTAATVEEALRWVGIMAARLQSQERERIELSELTLGLQCGGSDAASGVTANPTLGVAADLLVASGGSVILGETPEIYGAEHLLCDRAVSPSVAEQIREKVAWWVDYTAANGALLDSNPSRGNRDGGITTIWEKSLGAVLKAGTSPLRSVVDYAEPTRASGLTFMDTPGYDPVSATGMVAGGANMLAFTTGRGSVFGSRPVPCLKISSTTELYMRMTGDIDFDAGPAPTRHLQIQYGTRLFEQIVDTASGALSKSELLGFGAEEIAPWKIGAVL